MPIVTLTCPYCDFSKDLDQGSTPPDGAKVTCPKCRGRFAYDQSQSKGIILFRNDPAPRPADQDPSPPPLPPNHPPPQMHSETFQNQPESGTAHKLKRIAVKAAALLAVVVLIYGISHGYRNISAKHNADWGALKAIESAEQDEQDSIQSQADSFLAASNFDELDKIADSYRTSKAAFTDGEWKLCVFYQALSYYQRQVSEADWVSRLNMLKAWVAAKPDSITARVALAECLSGYAFFGRGAAYANEVQEDQWRRFEERLAEAKDVLDQAEKLQRKCPGWADAYLRLAVGLQWDKAQFNDFFASAIAKEPTYYVYYYRSAWYLLPWWYGEAGDWEDFAKSAADSVGGNDGDILYTRIVWFMKRRAPRDIITNNSRLQWQRIAAGIELIKAGKGMGTK